MLYEEAVMSEFGVDDVKFTIRYHFRHLLMVMRGKEDVGGNGGNEAFGLYSAERFGEGAASSCEVVSIRTATEGQITVDVETVG